METAVVVARVAIAAVLLAFASRRLVLLVAAMLPRRASGTDDTRSVAVLVAARNEAEGLPRLLAAIDRLEYPRQLMQVVLVSDGSTDATVERMRAWAASSPVSAHVVELAESRGKGGALAAALAEARDSDVVLVLDADCEPEAQLVQRLAGVLSDPTVGAVTAYPRPGNAQASVAARYAALERWMHHLVALAGKDRLALDPPIIGVAFLVRRSALVAVGGFPVDRVAEDLELSLALQAAGWRLRWTDAAVVREDVVTTFDAFVAQRTRWTRGTLQGARRSRSVEQLFVSFGYLDRVALVLAVGLAPFGVVPAWWVPAYLTVPAASVWWALYAAHAGAVLPFVWAALVMFTADIGVTVRATVAQLLGQRVRWSGRR